jgi:hypothetical protein
MAGINQAAGRMRHAGRQLAIAGLDNLLTEGDGCQPHAPAALYFQGTLIFCFWYSFLSGAE